MRPEILRGFLHSAQIFTSTVRDVLGEKLLRETTRYDLSLPQVELLRLIELNGDHQIRDIACFLGVSRAGASKNVDKLVRLGLLTRTVQDRDRRAMSLDLTTRGRNLVARYEDHKRHRLTQVLDQLPAADVAALARGLEQVSLLILKQEDELGDLCTKCGAYYSVNCPLRDLADGCIYARMEKGEAGAAASRRVGARAG